MSGDFDNNSAARSGGLQTFVTRAMARLRAFASDTSANVFVTTAIVAPLLLVLVGASLDYSYAVNAKHQLQDALDAATLAVSAAVTENPNDTETQLRAIAQSVLDANYTGTAPTITNFHVCAPVQNDCTSNGVAMQNDTVTIATQAQAPCTLGGFMPGLCTASNGSAQTLGVSTTTVIGFGATMQLNLVLDTSASMIVGATQNDVNLIAAWMDYSTTTPVYTNECTGYGRHQTCQEVQTGTTTTYPNWNAMEPNDPGPAFSGDNPQCAFACHDLGDSTTAADVSQGLSNAHTAGATTRFDVMTAAATQLINHVQSEVTSSQVLAKNTYLFNVYSFDTTLHTWGSSNMNYSSALSAISQVSPGLDTYLNTAMTSLVTTVGQNGNGSSSSSPLKFVMLVTDGLQSSRDNNWNCSSWVNTTNFGTYYINGQVASQCPSNSAFDGPINTTTCQSMKSNGVVLAVLETPYVPLAGQDPNVMPYERTVQTTIFPNGPGTTSAISTALSNCATNGYYFQATSSSDIATGFITLTDKFLSQMSYISK